jgi:hypothetical protein
VRIESLTPVVQAAPGDLVIGRVRLVNDGVIEANYVLQIVGLDDVVEHLTLDGIGLAAGEHIDIDVPMTIPSAFAAGRHSVAVQATSDRPGERPSLTELTVAIESIERLGIEVRPSTVRGRRRGRFTVDLTNREPETLDLTLEGDGHDVAVRLAPYHVVLPPGKETRVKGRLRGPSHVTGEPLQHVFTITARGRSHPSSVTASFHQKPSVPRPLRILALGLSVLTLWAAILGYGVYWYAKNHNKPATPADQAALTIDTNGDGIPDAPASAANGQNGSANGAAGAGGGGGAAGAAESTAPGDQAPTVTVVNGKVKAGDTGEDAGVAVTLAPLDLGAPPPAGATVVGSPGTSVAGALKLWPARFGFHQSDDTLRQRATMSVETRNTATDGAWLFPDVAIRANYELHFAKAGFDSQSFVVTPPSDGSPVKLDVQLLPAKGTVSGIVVATDGTPLGGVDIVVSDGTLTFNTTSSTTAGAVGTWSLAGVSTPSTYTLTATLRGYGTEVLQLPMDPGAQKSGVRIVMTPGVGSVSGHVTAAGKPLGGVTITASTGDLTRTTTTLTEGDTGFYSFPQLPIPGDYTVSVDVPGYVTQTRRVTVTGNVTDVDFALVKTTGTITGIVVSDLKGPLSAASVTIAKDALTFRTVTAVQPDPGSFTVSDLPPGTYLVEFSRFDHRTASQLVDIAAGETKDLGTITLVFEERPTVDQTGRIVVSVTDTTNAPLTGATVTVIDISTGNVIATLTDSGGTQATFAFDRVPIGTYTVRVNRPIYRTATQRVSVGLGEVRLTFQLLKLGQVSGRIVDSLLPAKQLTDYEVTLFRVNPDNSEDRVQAIVVAPNAAPNADGEILWESTPNSLTTGTYRVAVTRAPPGYAVVNDQILDNTLPITSPRMRFQIRPDNEAPVRVNDIAADPFPELTGHVYVPTLADPANNQVTFGPIDADMTVTLTCPGGLTANVPATLTDEIGNSPGIDTYTFDPVTIQQQNLLGICVITVTAAGFSTATVTLSAPLGPSDGISSPNQIVNIGLFPPPQPLGGPVFWRDLGLAGNQEVPVNGALVRTVTPVIVGFAAAQGNDPNAPPRPVNAPAGLQTTSSNGLWQLDGQVFGQTTYEFSNPVYTTGTMRVTVDQTQRTITALSSLVVEDRGGATAVQMSPRPGSIQGTVQIATVGAPQFTAVGLSATPPGGAPIAVPVTNTGAFTVNPAAAGTWRLDVTPPANHVIAPNSAATLTGRVDPNTAFTGFAPSLIELGTVTVRVLDVNGQPIDVGGTRPSVTLSHTNVNVNGDPASSSVTQTADATGTVTFTNVDVNRINPLAIVPYTVTIAMPGFDTSTATTTIVGSPSATAGSGPSFTVNVVAGAKPVATVRLPRFGSIASRVVGQIGPDGASPTEPIPVGPPLSIVAQRVFTLDLVPVADAPVPVTVDPLDANGFTFTGAEGFYRIDVSHPFFASPPVSVPASDFIGSIFYTMRNDTRNTLFGDAFVLRILAGTLSLRTVVSLATNTPVVGAVVTLRRGVVVVASGTVDGAGQFTASNLTPGPYALDIRVRSTTPPVEDFNFPVTATIEIPRGATAADRTLTVRAPMPLIGGSITGNVVAQNVNGDPVPLPDTITIGRTLDVPQLDANGDLIDNTADEGDLAQAVGNAPPPPLVLTHPATPLASSLPITFQDLAAPARHHLSFSTAAGYDAPTPNPVDVDVDPIAPTDSGDRAYVAHNVSVVVQLRDQVAAPITTATVTLSPPGGGAALTPSVANGNYTFSGVAPDLRNYLLNVTDAFHEDLVNDPVTVLPEADGNLTITRTLNSDAAIITGTAQKQDGPGLVSAIVGTGTVQLFKLTGIGDTVGTLVTSTTPGTGGAYQFSVADPGSYRIQVVLAGYAPRDTAVSGVALGSTVTATNVVVPKFATVAITVAGGATTEATLAVVMTQPSPPVAATRTGNVFTFANLDPDLLYAFRVSANTYLSQNVPATGTLDPTVGSNNPFTVTLVQRTVTVTLSTSDTSGAENSATVHLRVPPGNVAGQLTRTGTGTSNVYTFVPVPVGAGEVDATATGYRTQTAAFADGGPTQNVAITLLPLVTLTGVVRAGGTPVSGATVTATLGATTKTATTNATGNYSISGLDVGAWSITAVKDGTGATTTASTLTVTATSASAVTQDLTLTARTIAFTFTVTNGGTAVSGASVNLDSVSGTTSAAGTVTLNAVETGALAWTVSSGTIITKSGVASLASPAIAVAVASRPTLTGTVNNGATPQPGATVHLCLDPQATCTNANDVGAVTSAADGTFSFRPDVGTWQVRATFTGNLAATVTNIVVGADGSISKNALVLALA